MIADMLFFIFFLWIDRRKSLLLLLNNDYNTLERNVKGQFKYAARKNVKQTIVIGDEELKKGVVQLKDMDAHEQREVPFDEILSAIR